MMADVFGFPVALADDTAVIGRLNDFGSAPASAYVFRYDGASWVEEAKLTAPAC